ncbi:MAG: FAD-dependent oxidoreductase, partial [bacterium]
AEGRPEDVRPCTACITCESRMVDYEGLACQVNASIGRGAESEFPVAETRKNVAVVGGGPAGMEAARVMALRGHDITLYEKETYLGGLLNMAALVKGTEIFNLTDLVNYFRGQLEKLGVDLRLGEEFTPALADRTRPDVIIVAGGGVADTPSIPGIDGSNVLSSAELRKRARPALRLLDPKSLGWVTKKWLPVGKRVVIIGGGIQGCETAEFLVKRGRQVTIVDAGDQVGTELPLLQRILLLPWLGKKGANIMTGVTYKEVTAKGLVVADDEGRAVLLEADTVLVALPLRPDPGLYEALQGKAPEVFAVGDCNEPGLIIDAVAAGFTVARAI